MESEEETHSLSSYELLHLAENHLRLRNYSLSSQYALESLHPTANSTSGYNDGQDLQHRAQRIVAVSDILFAASQTLGSSDTNWYSVLGVDTFCGDINLIRSKLKSLLLLLDPMRSTFPPADEAMKSVWKAWGVLGSPEKKSELDALLKEGLVREKFGVEESDNFWTVCPYCYYMYEYPRVYEGYCLRCQNDGCRRVFQGVSAPSPPVVDSNVDECFNCYAYFPLGFSHSEDARKGKKLGAWSPFVGKLGLPAERTGPSAKRKVLDDNAGFVEISDDSDDSEAHVGYGNGNIEVPGVGSHVFIQRGRRLQTNSDAMVNGGVNEGGYSFDQNDEDYGFVSDADMLFVEKDGEIFLEVPPGDED